VLVILKREQETGRDSIWNSPATLAAASVGSTDRRRIPNPLYPDSRFYIVSEKSVVGTRVL